MFLGFGSRCQLHLFLDYNHNLIFFHVHKMTHAYFTEAFLPYIVSQVVS